MMRGKLFREGLWSLLISLFLAACITLAAGVVLMRHITDGVVKSKQALVGAVSRVTGLNGDQTADMLQRQTEQDRTRGAEILSGFGYTTGMRSEFEPILQEVTNFPLWLALYILILAVPLAFFFFWTHRRMRVMTERLVLAAERAVEGDYSVPVADGEDGDYDRLCHQFNHMRTRLSESLDALQQDHLHLKNTMTDISHQLKTPLTTAMMMHELLLSHPEMSPETQKEFLTKGDTALQRMEWLIYSLLKISSLESGSIPLKAEPLDLLEVAQQAIGNLRPFARQHGVTLSIDIQTDHCLICGDIDWLAEAVGNLIKNAIEHAGEDRLVQVRVSATPLMCKLQVMDHGVGIPDSQRERIFERFYRSGGSDSSGIGIGLALARLIIRRMDGDVWAESGHAKGATFAVVFHRI